MSNGTILPMYFVLWQALTNDNLYLLGPLLLTQINFNPNMDN